MRGKLTMGVGLAGLALLALSLPGAAAARGGNHGCDAAAGSFHSDHFREDGDTVVVASNVVPAVFPTPAQEFIRAENGFSNSAECGAPVGTWKRFTSGLGPGDDLARLDGVGIQGKFPARPLLKRVKAVLDGGGGADRLYGHAGVDRLLGGPGGDILRPGDGSDVAKGEGGRDVIQAADGRRDRVLCGPGADKAVVDAKDRVAGCERTVRH